MTAGRKGIERLQFRVTLRDRVTQRLGKLTRRLNTFHRSMNRAAGRIRSGAIAATTALLGMAAALLPAIGHSRELAKLSTLGLDANAIGLVEKAAFKASSRFGISASAIVGSAYDIQSAIAGLSSVELARFTSAAAALGKATGATPSVISDYLGTLYGIFGREADRIGRGTWVDITAGMTAQAVYQFKLSGPKLAQAFSTLGADAVSAGITQAEQFSVLGSLGATLKGGEAGSKFKGFLRGVGKAQSALGLTFTDAKGAMLPVVDILDRIRGKFGDIGTVAASDKLKKAFGSDEAVSFLKLLIGQTDQLRKNTERLGRTKGLEAVLEMADFGTITFDRFTQSTRNLAIAFSGKLLKALEPVLLIGISILETVRGWMDRFPNLTKLLAVVTFGLFGVAAVLGIITVLSGVFGVIAAGAILVWAHFWVIVAVVVALIVGVIALINWWDKLTAAVGRYWEAAMDVVVVGVIALINWWDKLTAAVGRFWEAAMGVVVFVAGGFAKAWTRAVDTVRKEWQRLVAGFKEFILPITSFFGFDTPPEFASSITQEVSTEAVEPSAREAIQRGSQGGLAGGNNTFNFHVQKMDAGTFRRFLSLEGAG